MKATVEVYARPHPSCEFRLSLVGGHLHDTPLPRDRRSFLLGNTNTQTAFQRLEIRDWARLEQTRSELPLSRDGADALGQSAPMAAYFQLWSHGSSPGQLRGDCSYRFDPRRLSSEQWAELPRLAPSK